MIIERVVKFKTSDGEEFVDQDEAKAHQTKIETEASLKDILASGLSAGRIDAVIGVMVNHAVEVRDTLNMFIKKQPRPKKKSVRSCKVA